MLNHIRENYIHNLGKAPIFFGATTLLEMKKYEKLVTETAKIHENLEYVSVCVTTREPERKLWHHELISAAHEAILNCLSSYNIKPPDPVLRNLAFI